MAVRGSQKTLGVDAKTYTLSTLVLQGMNEAEYNVSKVPGLGKVPALGKLLQRASDKAAEYVPVAKNFTAKEFVDFYHSIEADLERYGAMTVVERKLYTPAGLIESLEGARSAYERVEPVRCGSMLRFESSDKTLEGKLYVGYSEDREVVKAEGHEMDMSKKLEWAIAKLKKEGVKGAADLASARLLSLVWGPLAVVGMSDLSRRVYNMTQFDAHWSLELLPKAGEKVTTSQFEAYRGLVEKYKTQ